MARRRRKAISVETLTHASAARRNIPTAEYQPVMADEDKAPVRIAYERRNRDLDPQLVWRGKDEPNAAELVAQAPTLYIQEKVHPKVLIDDLLRHTGKRREEEAPLPLDLFANFNGLSSEDARAEFYQHDAKWANRMILGDSLQVMASLAEREGLRGKVQCIFVDPPYGIKFNSNFQWSTTSRSVKDGEADHITREPEQVKAFRDTWRDGVHSYLTYLRDRLIVARDLLTDNGSVFVQIGEENAHRVRMLMDEIFGDENFIREIFFAKTGSLAGNFIGRTGDRIIWFARDRLSCKFRPLYQEKGIDNYYKYLETAPYAEVPLTQKQREMKPSEVQGRIFQYVSLESSGAANEETPFEFCGETFRPSPNRHWQVSYPDGMNRLARSGRISKRGSKLRYKLYIDDYPVVRLSDVWTDTSGFAVDQIYVVETRPKVVERCILMTTDPSDLVLDPTCGSGTTATVAEQWGRRWITIDTSRVALALARGRIMGSRYPYYRLADGPEGLRRGTSASSAQASCGDIRHGFVYERVPHVTLKSIARNTEIDMLWDRFQGELDTLCEVLNRVLKEDWEEWEVPKEEGKSWPEEAREAHRRWWSVRIARHKAIEASIARHSEQEYRFDKPHVDDTRIRVAGPFTVESASPHRMLAVDEKGNVLSAVNDQDQGCGEVPNFSEMILDNLRVAGIQQTHKEDRIDFVSIAHWPGHYVCGEGRYIEGNGETGVARRAGIFIGPEFGTVARPDLAAAAREASEAGFDVLIALAFSYDAHVAEFDRLGRVPVLKARMNADLHVAGEYKNTGKGNLFVIFGEPDIEIIDEGDESIRVRIKGVDVYHPNTGEVRSDGPDGIACWFVDTDYNEESFFVRHAYFLGANDPYKSLKRTLKAEIDREAWDTLHSDVSRPFSRPASGRIAVKVINHLGDEVMKVFKV